MTCAGCKYLKESDKKEGCVCGSKYYCTKLKEYVRGSDDACSNYDKSYGRSNYEYSKIYEEGESYYDDSRSTSSYVVILVLFIILAIILNVFGG